MVLVVERKTAVPVEAAFSVILPTADRPIYLRDALQSVRAQSAVGRIGEIIVSENAGNRQSEKICAEFPDLPIVYRFRDPPIPRMQHYSTTLNEARYSLSAFLFDDDWWMPDHLMSAWEALRDHPEASAYGSTCYYIEQESGFPVLWEDRLLMWMASGFGSFDQPWVINCRDLVKAFMARTPVLYSTMVGRTDTMREAIKIHSSRNPYDNDRQFFFELSKYGPVIFVPHPEVMYRFHASNDQHSFSKADIRRFARQTTEWLIDYCEAEGIAVRDDLESAFDHCPRAMLRPLLSLFNEGPVDAMRVRGILPWQLDSFLRRRRWVWIYHLLMPPFLANVASRVVRLLRRKSA